MTRIYFSSRSGRLLIAVLGMLALPGAALAQPAAYEQPSEQITVFAPYLVQKKQIKTDIRSPVLYVSVRRQVSYSDLDLRKPADAAIFESRINDAAGAACKQLDILYPPRAYVPVSNVKDCVKSASEQALTVAGEIIAFWHKAPR